MTGDFARSKEKLLWSPVKGNGQAGDAILQKPFTAADEIIIDKSGSEDQITPGRTILADIDHDGLLIRYSFDQEPGTRQMPNQGTMPDINAGGLQKSRGDLDSDWQADADFGPGKFGNALTFAGTPGNADTVMSVGCPTPIGKPRTVSFWLKTNQDGAMEICSWGETMKNMGDFTIGLDKDGKLHLGINKRHQTSAADSPILNDGEWHHCALILSEWNTQLKNCRFFIDGQYYDADSSSDQTILTTNVNWGNKGLPYIGRGTSREKTPFVDSLDVFTIWGRELTEEEISDLAPTETSAQ
jgi:hypothetical protein